MIVDLPLPLEGLAEPVDLASIPLPETPSKLTIVEHDRRYPTQAGLVEGIVHIDEHAPGARNHDPVRTTVQCAVCLRTATGKGAWWVIVVSRWNHGRSDDEMTRQPTPYKRCPDCRAAGRHPEDAS